MTEPVSEGWIYYERVEKKYASNNSIKIEGELKLKLMLQDTRDEKESALQNKECREKQSCPVYGAKKPPVVGQPHPYPQQRQNKANTLAKDFSFFSLESQRNGPNGKSVKE